MQMSRRLLTLGIILGLGLGGYLYLTAYYEHGALLLDGGAGRGGYRIYLAMQQYEQATRTMATSGIDVSSSVMALSASSRRPPARATRAASTRACG